MLPDQKALDDAYPKQTPWQRAARVRVCLLFTQVVCWLD
jgi:hypothetical protein